MDERVKEAQKAIARILAKLEADTGSVVRSVTIKDIDVTTFGDDRIQMQRLVALDLERLPGTRWEQ
jgi:hypothetical protein